ncbi:flavin reductase family protein [Sphingobium sp. H39-3-25]|nr:flavin reductase family protein [Sphingobium arseniciresistens]
MAATAVSELSLDPPSMLICVNRTASIHPVLSRGMSFAINILHHDHADIAANCSGKMKGEERFSVGEWQMTPQGVPFLADCQAAIICHNDKQLDYGTHSLFIGRVADVSLHGDVSPLIYVDGRFTRAMERDTVNG